MYEYNKLRNGKVLKYLHFNSFVLITCYRFRIIILEININVKKKQQNSNWNSDGHVAKKKNIAYCKDLYFSCFPVLKTEIGVHWKLIYYYIS